MANYVVPGHSRDIIFWHEVEAEIPAYGHFREDLEAERLDLVHAVDTDRLGRDAAIINRWISLAERHDCEVYLASAPHPVGHQSPGHLYLHAIQAVRASEDQDRRIAMIHAGMQGRIMKRGMIANQAPIGYTTVRDTDSGEPLGWMRIQRHDRRRRSDNRAVPQRPSLKRDPS